MTSSACSTRFPIPLFGFPQHGVGALLDEAGGRRLGHAVGGGWLLRAVSRRFGATDGTREGLLT